MDWAASDSAPSLFSGDGDSILSVRRFSWSKPVAGDDPCVAPEVKSVAEAVERVKQIQRHVEINEPRGRHDGVACFNQLFHSVLTRLEEGLVHDYFADERFVSGLAVALANRYFNVLKNGRLRPESNPASWRVLLERRSDPDIAGILFTTGGLNALLNLDMSVALLATTYRKRFDRNLAEKHADYLKVVGLIVDEVDEIRGHFSTSLIRAIEPEVFNQVDTALRNWSVQEARDAAWMNAGLLKRLRDHRVDKVSFLCRLDELVGMTNSLLLAPAA